MELLKRWQSTFRFHAPDSFGVRFNRQERDSGGLKNQRNASEMLELPIGPEMPKRPETSTSSRSRVRHSKWPRRGAYAVFAVLAVVFSGLFVPEGRRLLGLERPKSVRVAAPREVPSTSTSRTGHASKRVAGVVAATMTKLRERDGVTRMPVLDSDYTLARVPAGTFGFADVLDVSDVVGSGRGTLRLEPNGPTQSFEIHKLQSGRVLLAGFAGLESQNRLRVGLGSDDQVTIYSEKWTGATLPIAYPLDALRCGDPRALYPKMPDGRFEFIYALDCRARKKP